MKKHLEKMMQKRGSKTLFLLAAAMILGATAFYFWEKQPEIGTDVALEWHRFLLEAERNSDGFVPPVAARAAAYVDLTAFEAAANLTGSRLVSQAERWPDLQLPTASNLKNSTLPAVLNAAYSRAFSLFYPRLPADQTVQRAQIETKMEACFLEKGMDEATLAAAKTAGRAIAEAIFEWSKTDSIGHEAFRQPFDRAYKPPRGQGLWQVAEDFPLPAVLPNWGKARPFLTGPDSVEAHPPLVYSEEKNAPMFTQALELVAVGTVPSAENRWIVEFWNDGHLGVTFTPSGHWTSIVNQVIEAQRPSVERVLETYLKVSLAMHDAAVVCWALKYRFNTERPAPYIRRVIDKNWQPMLPAPSFPGYPSGHAMFAGAAAAVLTELFGDHFSMTDRSHDCRTEFNGTPRSFHSFYEMAYEDGFSRIPMGVHFRQDSEEGLRLGMLIGRRAARLETTHGSGFALK